MDKYVTRNPNINKERTIRGPANHTLQVIQLNCGPGGLNSTKRLELNNFLYAKQPDIVLLQETWFKDNVIHQFHGYSMIQRNRHTSYKTTGGGVAILLRESAGFTYAPINEATAPNDQCSDIIHAKLKWNCRELIVTSLYNPPVSSRPRGRQGFSADYTLSACARNGTNHIIGGDFNAHSMTWDLGEEVVETEEGDQIVEWLLENGATLGNTGEPTLRHATTGRWSAIDLSIQMGEACISDWRTIPDLGFSDHVTISFNVRWDNTVTGERERTRTAKKETKFCYKKADWKKFNRRFEKAYREFVDVPRKRRVRRKRHIKSKFLSEKHRNAFRYVTRSRSNPVELESRRILSAFQDAMKTIPQGCRKDPVPWWDSDIDEAIVQRAQLRKACEDKQADPATLEHRQQAYRTQVETTRDLIRSKRTASWQRFATDNLRYTSDPRRTAALISQLDRTARPSPIQILKDQAGHVYETEMEKARAFLKVYSLNCKQELKPLGPNPYGNFTDRTQRRLHRDQLKRTRQREKVGQYVDAPTVAPPVSRAELVAALRLLHENKATGSDRVSNEMLKNLSKKNLDKVFKLINISVTTGYVPSAWKSGQLIPLPKPGKDSGFIESYRPVCLLGCIGKLADRIITTRLSHIVESQGILPHSQAGFRKGRTTEDPLMDIVSDLHQLRAHNGPNYDKSPYVLLLLDLEKAFERVDPWILLRTMQRLGIPRYLVKWFRGFLIDRRYRVKWGGMFTKWVRFALGVPQGSISGPLLFTIYLSTLTKKLDRILDPTVRHAEYADDISIWARVRKLTNGNYNLVPLQYYLDIISRWSTRYGINVSTTKTTGVIFYKDPRGWTDNGMDLHYRGTPITWSKAGKSLGIHFDNTLGFNRHCNDVITKARWKLALIHRIVGKKWGGSTGDTRAACLSQVLPILTYGSSIWGPLISEGARTKLQQTVNLMARITTGTHRATNVSSLLLEANMDFIDRYIDDRTIAAVERLRRRSQRDKLHNKSMGPTPTVRRSKVFKSQCWQQRSDTLQARYKIRSHRFTRQKRTGKLTRTHAKTTTTSIPITQAKLNITSRVPLFNYHNIIAPHATRPIKIRFYPTLLEPVTPDTPIPEKNRIAEDTIARLRRRGTDWELWTDASVVNGKGVGVAHLYTNPEPVRRYDPVTRQWNAPDTRKWEIQALAGEGVHSYTAECLAVEAGLSKLAKQLRPNPRGIRLLIATDCLSLVLALERGPINLKDPVLAHIWKLIYKLFDRDIARIAFQWIPAHCNIMRNEFADARAKSLLANHRESDMRKVPMLYSTAVAHYKAQNRAHHHNRLIAEQTDRSRITTDKANLRAENNLTRAQQTTLAQLRTGTCTSMGWYVGYCRSGYDSNHKQDPCRWCGAAPETVLHVFNDCTDLQIQLLRGEYKASTNRTLNANTLCTDQQAALEFHAAAVRVIGAAGGGL